MDDPRFKAGEFVILLSHETPEESHTAGLVRVEMREKRPELHEDTPHVFDRFEAVCQCAAAIHFDRKLHDDTYDMYFCREDKKNGDPVCPNFEQLRARTSE